MNDSSTLVPGDVHRPGRRRRAAFVVWRGYQGRVDGIAETFGLEPWWLGLRLRGRAWRPVEYLTKLAHTLWLLARERPDEIWLQLPPTVKLYGALLYRVVHPRVVIVADCHNGTLRSPWVSTPGLRWAFRHAVDCVIFHNSYAFEQAVQAGLPAERMMVLETPPATPDSETAAAPDYARPWVVFPASFLPDEPIGELLAAARTLPWVTFVITGEAREAIARGELDGAPENVVVTGWIDRAAYRSTIATANVVVGLTKFEGIQLSVANEATGFGRAMVLSDTRILRELFHRGACYVESRADSIAEGIEQALARQALLEAESRLLREQRLVRWRGQAEYVQARLQEATRDKQRSES